MSREKKQEKERDADLDGVRQRKEKSLRCA